MPNKRGPTGTKRQRERSRRERQEKKEKRREQREADRKAALQAPPPEVAAPVEVESG
jgi:hypothetical protein